ncbi:putative transcriptional activator TenA [Chondrocystis sp. NIES-4102]|nr:putative transcriptional activator TenA [Chondrocystis sp. NIES-4102]
MNFAARAWKNIDNIYNSILTMEFIQELQKGSLSPNLFQQYIIQDAIYLGEFSRTLAIISAKAPTPELQLQFARNSQDALVVERSLHEEFFAEFNISAKVALASQPSPTCLNYTNFLLATAYQYSFAVGVAAVVPCFWIYLEVGKYIYQHCENQVNPYQKWIDTYIDPDFETAVQEVIRVANSMAIKVGAEELELMNQVFYRASQFEWMFWDSAYNLETWKI